MTFTYPKSALPPKRTVGEEIEAHLLAQEQYRRLRAAYVEIRRKEDETFRSYGHNNSTAEPPPEEVAALPNRLGNEPISGRHRKAGADLPARAPHEAIQLPSAPKNEGQGAKPWPPSGDWIHVLPDCGLCGVVSWFKATFGGSRWSGGAPTCGLQSEPAPLNFAHCRSQCWYFFWQSALSVSGLISQDANAAVHPSSQNTVAVDFIGPI
jgi:hypothetical protein